MKKLMHIFFLSCFKATELIEKKIYSKLSLKEKIQLKVHKTMCSACTNYEKQSYIIDKALSHSPEPSELSVDLSALKKSTLSKIEKNNQD